MTTTNNDTRYANPSLTDAAAIFALCRVTLHTEADGVVRGYIPAYQHQPNTAPVVARLTGVDGFEALRDFNLVARPRPNDRMRTPVLKAVRKGDTLRPIDVYAFGTHTDVDGAIRQVVAGDLDRLVSAWAAQQERLAQQARRYAQAKKEDRRDMLAAAYAAKLPHLVAMKKLGLAVVKADVTYHGKVVGVRDEDGRGVEFTVACKVAGHPFAPGDVLTHTELVELASGR